MKPQEQQEREDIIMKWVEKGLIIRWPIYKSRFKRINMMLILIFITMVIILILLATK